jgi:N-acetylglucosaminyldiphosphoundecaprenol N-acetyl-beta-D-mannosaminyltransferase
VDHGDRVHVGPLALDPLTMKEAVGLVRSFVQTESPKAKLIATANAQFAQVARADHRFHDILDHAEMVVADGMSVVAASRFLGRPLPERINGTDLLVEICREAAATGMSVYFLGGKPHAATGAANQMQARFPLLRVAGVGCPPLGFERNPAESEAVVESIRAAVPDILFVGLGAPKQEFWMEEHGRVLPVKVMVGVGGSFEILSGMIPRAPLWMQRAGMEWLFRLAHEPARLWKRYLFGNAEFIQMVMWQFVTGSKAI